MLTTQSLDAAAPMGLSVLAGHGVGAADPAGQ